MRRFFCVLLALAVPAAADEIESLVREFAGVFAAIESLNADPIDSQKAFYEGAIPGMLRGLDPHSVFLDPAQFDQLKQLQTSTQKGFGSVVSVLPGRVIFLQTLPGTPSSRAGLAPGDELVSLNGYAIERLEMEQLIALLGQSRQGPARLEVRRPGNARILTFVMVPEQMQSPPVERVFHLKEGVGYLRVSSFDEKTGPQIREGIEKLGGHSLKGLVLDLRNNPGGLVPAALETASLFLQPGQSILTARGRRTGEHVEKVPEGNQPYTFPVAVLLNGRSASASEIVAGSLQDHDRGVVVGEPSYGKGLVESVFPLSDNAGLALTTSLYYTPSGRSIQKPLGKAFALSERAAQSGGEFRTASGRRVRGGGGIEPDHIAFPRPHTRLSAFLDASGAFTTFATQYTQSHPGLDASFQVTPQILDEFQVFLSQRNVRPGLGEWSHDREYIRNRLKTEIFNLAFGVEKGDEVEAERDPVILKALDALAAPLQ